MTYPIPETEAQSRDVHTVLDELGLTEERRDAMIEVWNKTDLLPQEELAALMERRKRQSGMACPVSAVTGEGVAELLQLIEERISGPVEHFILELPPTAGADIAWLYEHGTVTSRESREDGTMLFSVRFNTAQQSRAKDRFGDTLKPVSADADPIAAE